MQARDAVPKREGPVRLHTSARDARQDGRREPQRADDAQYSNRKGDSFLPPLRACDGDQEQTRHRAQPDDARGPIGMLAECDAVLLATQRLKRRHSAQRKQRLKRAHQRHPHARENAGDDRLRGEPDAHSRWEIATHRRAEDELKSDAECGTHGCAGESERSGLRDVDHQHLPARGAEAAQHGDRVDLADHEGAHAARHADAAEQERDESDEREEVAQVADRLAHAVGVLLRGTDANALPAESRPEPRGERVLVQRRRQPQHDVAL